VLVSVRKCVVDEREGGCMVFSRADLSTLSTTYMSDDAQMLSRTMARARANSDCESINLSTMELWNSLPDNLRHLDLCLGQFR